MRDFQVLAESKRFELLIPERYTAFRVRLVVTTSITLRIFICLAILSHIDYFCKILRRVFKSFYLKSVKVAFQAALDKTNAVMK